MECSNCGKSLSLQDANRNEWQDEAEVFVFVCPGCSAETKIIARLFESGHISSQYLEMIVLDTEDQGKEKYLDYIPGNQKQKLIKHLASCEFCSDKLERLRLNRIANSIEFKEATYSFFLTQAKEVYKVLQIDEFKKNGIGLKLFVFEGVSYQMTKDDLFYNIVNDKKRSQCLCYILEKDSHNVGMVSFIMLNDKVILEKIWLKSSQRILKEKKFLDNLKNSELEFLTDIVRKSC